MIYSDPKLEADVQAWMTAAKLVPVSNRGHHMLKAPQPLMDCLHCHADLRGLATGVQTLGAVRGRFWRYHKCPVCQKRFVAGVPAQSSEIVTEDVERMFKWFPRWVYRRMREAEAEAWHLQRMLELEQHEQEEDRLLNLEPPPSLLDDDNIPDRALSGGADQED